MRRRWERVRVVDVRALRLIASCVAVVVLAACGGPDSAVRPHTTVAGHSVGRTTGKTGNGAGRPDSYPVSPTQAGLLGVPVALSLMTGTLSGPPATIVTTVEITLEAVIRSATPLSGCPQFACGAPPPESGIGEWSAFRFRVSNLAGQILNEAGGYGPGADFTVDSNPRAQLTPYGFVGCPALNYGDLRPGSTEMGCLAIWVPAGRAAPQTVVAKVSIGGIDATDPSVRWSV